MGGISHSISLDAALQQRYPDATIHQELPSQPRWQWFARACQIKHGVPSVLLIEANIGYLLLIPKTVDSAYEFGLDHYDALLDALGIHPEDHEVPNEALFSFDPNPEHIRWGTSSIDDLALQRRLNEATQLLATMSPAQGRNALVDLNRQPLPLAVGDTVPEQLMSWRLRLYADLWREYAENTNFIVHAWHAWRKKKPWLDVLEKK